MSQPRCGIVIGHYNQPDFLELNIAAIRHHCGDVPILVSDDCSDGFGSTPKSGSVFHRVLRMTERYTNVRVLPNVERIGHCGGDMACVWKAIYFGASLGADVVFKLSTRLIVDTPNWVKDTALSLMQSDYQVAGNKCQFHGFLRLEAIGIKIAAWNQPDILAHLTPRRIAWPTEQVVWDDIRDRFNSRMMPLGWMSDARPQQKAGVLFRESNGPEDYSALAAKIGLDVTDLQFDCRRSESMPGFLQG